MEVKFSVAMLAGGASRRMGTDKALIDVDLDGKPMAARIIVAAILSGAHEVIAVGGNRHELTAHGWSFVEDMWPGEGPLGGLITALESATTPIVVVLACDHPDVDPEEVQSMVESLSLNETVDAAIPVLEGHPYVTHSVWRKQAVVALRAAFESGERAPSAVLRKLPWVPLRVNNARSVADIDTVSELAERRTAGRATSL
jgi:molybdenum cofactor guanylyltransferase